MPARCRLLLSSLVGVLLLLGPAPLLGQSIQGRLLDWGAAEPISGADVLLLDSAGSIVRTVVTDSGGTFVLQAPGPGRYHLRGRRIGYVDAISHRIELAANETIQVEFRMSVEPVELAPLNVVSRSSPVLDPRLEGQGYYERRAQYGTGFAHFLEWEEIRKRDPWSLVGVLHTIPGVRIRSAGGRRIVVTGRGGCPLTLYVDGARIGPLSAGNVTLDEIVPSSQAVAIEIYPGMMQSLRFTGPCGSLVVWTGVPTR